MRLFHLAAVAAASLGLTFWAIRALTRRRARRKTQPPRAHDDLRLTNL